MPSLKNQIRLTMIMAFVSLAALLFSHLALTDIYHGESDQSLEWHIVRVTAVIVAAFIVSTIYTLTRVLSSIK